jgi:hypothetical protein
MLLEYIEVELSARSLSQSAFDGEYWQHCTSSGLKFQKWISLQMSMRSLVLKFYGLRHSPRLG